MAEIVKKIIAKRVPDARPRASGEEYVGEIEDCKNDGHNRCRDAVLRGIT